MEKKTYIKRAEQMFKHAAEDTDVELAFVDVDAESETVLLSMVCDNPAGEDWRAGIKIPFEAFQDYDDFVLRLYGGVFDEWINFDIDEYVAFWLAAGQGLSDGVPSARELVENAEYKKKKLQEFHEALRDVLCSRRNRT